MVLIFYLSNSVFFMPFLAAVMLVYITEGTLLMQRLIIGKIKAIAMDMSKSYTAWGRECIPNA